MTEHRRNVNGLFPGFYRILKVDGRSAQGKFFGRRWRLLAPRLHGDSVKEMLLLQALRFEVELQSRPPSGHDLAMLLGTYRRLGLLDGGEADEQSLDEYLKTKESSDD